MGLKFRPLNVVSKIMQHVGFEPGYAYDDLVFSDNAVFLIQFDNADEKTLNLFFNEDCLQDFASEITIKMNEAARKENFTLVSKGKFSLNQENDKDEITIKFVEMVER
jgi:hypothetical protein